jgi:hypothetical protein
MPPRKKEAEEVEEVQTPEECRRYDGPWREDVVKLCGEYGVKALAAMNVVELAQLLGREDELEKAEVALAKIRRLVGIAPRPISNIGGSQGSASSPRPQDRRGRVRREDAVGRA